MNPKPTPNLWQHNCDVEYRDLYGNTLFLPLVQGFPDLIDDTDLAPTIEQRIDTALDFKRFDVVEQLVKHL